MQSNDTISELESIHKLFCQLTGSDPAVLRYRLFERTWYEYRDAGFSGDDLEHVIAWVKRHNKEVTEARFRIELVPSKIVRDLDTFCERLALEKQRRARMAARLGTAQERVLDNFRGYKRPEAPPTMKDTTQSVRDILREQL